MGKTYQCLAPLKQLFPNTRQLHPAYGNLPADVAPGDFGAHRAADDLVPKTNADDTDGLACEGFGHELDKSEDPGRGIEGAVSCDEGDRMVSLCSFVDRVKHPARLLRIYRFSNLSGMGGSSTKVTATHLIR